jgi:hypothetical protein
MTLAVYPDMNKNRMSLEHDPFPNQWHPSN